ncbi:hypothetical protein [Staphylococcus phage vB_StaM_SA1]|nr:hypothetical protein [Staphylococcus phage vB_StaM_SA1]
MAKNLKVGKDKYINVLVRFKNKAWTATLLLQLVNMVIFIIRAFGGDVSGTTEETLGSSVQVAAFFIATFVGHVMDGSSEGFADSERNLVKNSPTTNTEKSMQAVDYDGTILPPVKPFLEQSSNQESTNYQEMPSSNEGEETLGGGSAPEVRADSNYNPEIFGGGSSED